MDNTNCLTPTSQSLADVKFKELPFYEVIDEIIKPSILVDNSISNPATDMIEVIFMFTLSSDQVTYICMNRDISAGKDKYVYQVQIRIGLLKPNSNEIVDFMPLGLTIQLFDKVCSLPPFIPKTRPEIEDRRIAQPIDCTRYVKLNPYKVNNMAVNLFPEAKPYVITLNLVKKLTPEDLLQKLIDKEPKSSEDTKSDIIRKLANFDSESIITSYRFSLVCPLGAMKIKIPVKSINCNHIQCFDAATFILMNEQKPSWLCPTCKNPCLFKDLQIQSYFVDIISSPDLPNDCRDIELLADGSWAIHANHGSLKKIRG